MKKSTKFFPAALTALALVVAATIVFAQEHPVNTNDTSPDDELIIAPLVTTEDTAGELEEVNLDEDVSPEDLEVGDPQILPDHPLYFLKKWMRGIRLFLVFNPVAKAKLSEQFNNERVVELNKMVVQNKNANAIINAAQHYQDELEKMKSFTERIQETAQENEKVGEFMNKFIQQQALHQRILQQLENQVPSEVFDKIQETRQKHLDRFQDVMLKLEEKDKIPQILEENLQNLKNSNFKEIKNLEIFDDLTENLPDDLKPKMEQVREEITQQVRQRLETFSPEEQEQFRGYFERIIGNK